ncbi:MAG: radical SAM protein [Polyangiaceae bacterium]
MSSLGYQRVYRAIQEQPAMVAERVFLPDGADRAGAPMQRPVSYEGLRELGEFPLLAVSVAYEIELGGLARMLDVSGIPALAEEREERHPLVIAGGPLTFSNPVPLGAFADAIVMGEAEELLVPVLEIALGSGSRAERLAALAALDHVYVPSTHGEALPSVAACADELLPATSTILTPHTELSSMFLLEVERGCSRGCTYCVMRRTTNGGMRIVSPERVLQAIPEHATKVGLVGAAVSDHPRILTILAGLAERDLGAGLSSLRPDRLSREFVTALASVGYRTLTTALDGTSQRMRDIIERRGREQHYLAAAQHARELGMDRLKLYLMLGLPNETDDDVDECVRFVTELSRIIPVALGIAPFCSKRNTPLDRMPYAGVRTVQARLQRLSRGLKGRADVRSTSAKWAWVEHVLAQGGLSEGRALWSACQAGGRFADYRRAFSALGHDADGKGYREALPVAGPEWKGRRKLDIVST